MIVVRSSNANGDGKSVLQLEVELKAIKLRLRDVRAQPTSVAIVLLVSPSFG
eukprot:SAG11_NODE_814_length_7033_cov_57.557254_6_plen_52_part_00